MAFLFTTQGFYNLGNLLKRKLVQCPFNLICVGKWLLLTTLERLTIPFNIFN